MIMGQRARLYPGIGRLFLFLGACACICSSVFAQTVAIGSCDGPESTILEKKLAFPSPVQWKSAGRMEISLVAVAWGPAHSPEMMAKGRKAYPHDKPEFPDDLSCALALGFQARVAGPSLSEMYAASKLVRITDVDGNLQGPWALTPSGFVPELFDVHFAGDNNTTEYWNFFPASSKQKEFLFQAPSVSRSSVTEVSFKVVLTDKGFVVSNLSPDAQVACLNFTKTFVGTVGAHSELIARLIREGTNLSGNEQYLRIGKTLELKGAVDALGNFELEERYPKDRVTGIFKGSFSQNCQAIKGYFSKPDNSRLQPFELRELR